MYTVKSNSVAVALYRDKEEVLRVPCEPEMKQYTVEVFKRFANPKGEQVIKNLPWPKEHWYHNQMFTLTLMDAMTMLSGTDRDKAAILIKRNPTMLRCIRRFGLSIDL